MLSNAMRLDNLCSHSARATCVQMEHCAGPDVSSMEVHGVLTRDAAHILISAVVRDTNSGQCFLVTTIVSGGSLHGQPALYPCAVVLDWYRNQGHRKSHKVFVKASLLPGTSLGKDRCPQSRVLTTDRRPTRLCAGAPRLSQVPPGAPQTAPAASEGGLGAGGQAVEEEEAEDEDEEEDAQGDDDEEEEEVGADLLAAHAAAAAPAAAARRSQRDRKRARWPDSEQ